MLQDLLAEADRVRSVRENQAESSSLSAASKHLFGLGEAALTTNRDLERRLAAAAAKLTTGEGGTERGALLETQ